MQDVLEEYFRVAAAGGGGWDFEVCVIVRQGVHSPLIEWKLFRHWKRAPSDAQLGKAMQAALKDPRFLATCKKCGNTRAAGNMYNDDYCQSCASEYLEVVY